MKIVMLLLVFLFLGGCERSCTNEVKIIKVESVEKNICKSGKRTLIEKTNEYKTRHLRCGDYGKPGDIFGYRHC